MPLKTPAKPARKPAGTKVVRACKTAKTAPKKATPKSAAKPKATKTKATVAKKPVIRERANARTSQMDGARTIERKILGEASPRAPVSALLERVSSAIEEELSQIESMVSGKPVPLRQHGHAERRARMLASLARTLREVMRGGRGESAT